MTGRTEWENGELLGGFMEWNTVERAIDRNRYKNSIKRSGQARLAYVTDINCNIPATWRWARGDTQNTNTSDVTGITAPRAGRHSSSLFVFCLRLLKNHVEVSFSNRSGCFELPLTPTLPLQLVFASLPSLSLCFSLCLPAPSVCLSDSLFLFQSWLFII